MYAVNHHYHDHHDHQEEEIPQKFPYLEVWLNKFTTIHAEIKGQQTIGFCRSIKRTCRFNI
jgi:hypothetical protein